MSHKTYALIVGINEYNNIRKLKGCVKDIEKIEKYLLNQSEIDCSVKKLINDKATKSAIVDFFLTLQEHISETDTVLFYFSGHGTQEDADGIWQETDGLLECIVCYDHDPQSSSSYLLADKELRYLIHGLSGTGCHVATIFDCCHSGDNTRNAPLVKAAFANRGVNERRIYYTFPERNWEDFIFYPQVNRDAIKGRQANDFLPQGKHVQIAACESDESAIEINDEGVFTKALIKVLDDSGSNLSYHALVGRIRQYLRFVYEQQPRIYIAGATDIEIQNLLYTNFLNKVSRNAEGFISEAVYNEKKGWLLNLGAIHGITKKTNVKLVDPDSASTNYTAGIAEVFVDYSTLQLNEFPVNLKQEVCKAIVAGLQLYKLKLHIKKYAENPETLERIAALLTQSSSGLFVFTENELEADFTLHVRLGLIYLTRPNDQFRPIVKPLELVGFSDDQLTAGLKQLSHTLRHVSRYNFIKVLQNENINHLPVQPIKVVINEVLEDNSEKPIPVKSQRSSITFENENGGWRKTIRIKLTNQTSRKIYIAVAYLPYNFQVNLNFLESKVKPLNTGESVFLVPVSKRSAQVNADSFSLKLPDVAQEYNWPDYTETYKIIISTEAFNPEALSLPPLPLPDTLLGGNSSATARSADLEEDNPVALSDWMTQTIEFVYHNPTYNQVDSTKLNAMMAWDKTAYFATGLYFHIDRDNCLQPVNMILKEGIKLNVPEDERNLLTDLKISLANKIERMLRERYYQKTKLNSKRIRIVAKGDSWFQYPFLVKDIVYHLSSLYAIKSLATAGDTLRNYEIEREYLKAIEQEQPKFFLISGGGNDILGEQFEGYLADTPDPGIKGPGKYLRKQLYSELDKLQGIYRNIFTTVTNTYPDLHILVHGYDYIIPLDKTLPENATKPSWLGKYMVKKGIASQEDRKEVIRYILDAFNHRMEVVAGEFPKRVSYINVRGTVNREDYWYDEIHPNDKGFQDVAMLFINKINTILYEN